MPLLPLCCPFDFFTCLLKVLTEALYRIASAQYTRQTDDKKEDGVFHDGLHNDCRCLCLWPKRNLWEWLCHSSFSSFASASAPACSIRVSARYSRYSTLLRTTAVHAFALKRLCGIAPVGADLLPEQITQLYAILYRNGRECIHVDATRILLEGACHAAHHQRPVCGHCDD